MFLFGLVPNPFDSIGSSLWIRWQLQKAAILGGGLFGNGFGSSTAVIRSVEVAIAGKSDPHSWFGAILTDSGIIGLILYIMFYISLLMKCIKLSLNRDPLNITCTIVLLALPVAALGPGNAILFRDYWIFLSLSYSCYRLNHISDTNIGSSRLYHIIW
jgi:O-antigen ligase